MLLVPAFLLGGCNDQIEVQQHYDFAIGTWHLPEKVPQGEAVEIRITLRRQGDFKGAAYDIGYIQLQGRGLVQDEAGTRLVDREQVPLRTLAQIDDRDPCAQVFTLYYVGLTDKKSEVTLFVVDNFGLRREVVIAFDVEKTES